MELVRGSNPALQQLKQTGKFNHVIKLDIIQKRLWFAIELLMLNVYVYI